MRWLNIQNVSSSGSFLSTYCTRPSRVAGEWHTLAPKRVHSEPEHTASAHTSLVKGSHVTTLKNKALGMKMAPSEADKASSVGEQQNVNHSFVQMTKYHLPTFLLLGPSGTGHYGERRRRGAQVSWLPSHCV